MMALIGNGGHEKWSRWSVIAPADGKRLRLNGEDAMQQLRKALDSNNNDAILPNWIGYLSYEFGYSIEPASGIIPEHGWPLVDAVWCDRALIHDSTTNQWWSMGGLEPPRIKKQIEVNSAWEILTDCKGKDHFQNSVQAAVDFIHNGDVFQANITRRFSTNANGDIRSSALSFLGGRGGWYGAWLEFPDEGRFVMSLSPELFLQFNSKTRIITTRPMKGTRSETHSPEQLLNSEKDAAELHMIVDLMRNDLGRVCEFGSIKVNEARSIEKHPTVWQCVGEIEGKVKAEMNMSDILEATFPAGSITGAPKIRAMQIIQELESTPRGPYCGAIGIFGSSAMLSVAIRTALFEGKGGAQHFEGSMEYSTGCGIIAESNPHDEAEESEVKTHIMRPQHEP